MKDPAMRAPAMLRLPPIFAAVAILAGLTVSSSGTLAQALDASNGCRIDDPAAWRDAKQSGRGGCPAAADPQTLPEVLTLPLPCGRQAIFQRITVPAETLLDHQTITVGMPADDQAPISDRLFNRPRQQPLTGGFIMTENRTTPSAQALASPRGRAYYIGKYEVLKHHYALLTGGLFDIENPDLNNAAACKDYTDSVSQMSDRKVYPASNVSWFDAVEFLRHWSAWLMAVDHKRRAAGQPPLTPWEQGSPAYLRLPTEAEWEFAARGALLQDDSGATAYRISDGNDTTRLPTIEEIAAIEDNGSRRRSANDMSDPVGNRLPNLAGLYDTVGNVDEIIFDMFQLTRPDSLHGQFGGYVVKGGNRMTPLRSLGVSHRREVPFFTLSGETRAQTTGFRAVLAPPVIVGGTSPQKRWQDSLQNPALLEAFDTSLSQISIANDDDRQKANDGLDALRSQLEEGRLETGVLGDQIALIQENLNRSNTRLNERDREVRRERVRSAILVGFSISSMGANILGARNLEHKTRQESTAEQKIEMADQFNKLKSNIEETEKSLESSINFYINTVNTLAEEPADKVDAAIQSVGENFNSLKIAALQRFVDRLREHISQARTRNGNIDSTLRKDWTFQLDHTRPLRQRMFNSYPNER